MQDSIRRIKCLFSLIGDYELSGGSGETVSSTYLWKELKEEIDIVESETNVLMAKIKELVNGTC